MDWQSASLLVLPLSAALLARSAWGVGFRDCSRLGVSWVAVTDQLVAVGAATARASLPLNTLSYEYDDYERIRPC